MLRLRPMDEEGFRAFLDRAVPRRAERWVRRGLWTKEQALEASRREYAESFPQGRSTPGQFFSDAVEDTTATVVGEAWYSARALGGKVEFWIQWISIWPEFRRQGYGARLLGLLEDEARRRGADRTLLTVWTDNPSAQALYARLGYVVTNLTMAKPLPPVSGGAP